jgi:small subunit ribosomal protein S5
MSKHNRRQKEFDERVIRVSRVSTKTKGGDQMSFSVLMVIGDHKGRVGVGLGKAKSVVGAIKKGVRRAKKNLIEIPIQKTTIPFEIIGKHGAGQVLLKPARKGSGVIAGGPVRAVVEVAGVKDISAKILGSDNQASSVYATFNGLKKIKRITKVRGIEVKQEKDETETVKKKKSSKKKKPKSQVKKKKTSKKKADKKKKTTKSSKKKSQTKKTSKKSKKKTVKKDKKSDKKDKKEKKVAKKKKKDK